jgi:hypothetical protein
MRGENIKHQIAGLKFSSPPEKIEGVKQYEDLVIQLKQTENFSQYEPYLTRSGFLKFVEPPPKIPPYELRGVRKIYLDIEYKGFIESLSDVVGQLKVKTRSYFVKEGDQVEGYTIERVRSDYMLLKDKNGVEYKLPLRERVLGNDYEAALYVTKTHKIIKVEIGDMVDNFKVLDISPDNVVLFNQNNNQKLIVEK